ncbi:glycosyltransferase [Paracoccus albus]|uniref:glycosyltransferase n=1 Tax=Paracoccus albus TaxID=3017784 RepID=UPI0022F0726D|nr:glycosyltransferase [Paracoccus albus]WBU61896.1 glycosyltransferase [Paracoccus albus]
MNDKIVGICRFSFLGRGDWIGMRGSKAVYPALLEKQAKLIYAPERLARRFAAFETVFLPWVRAQTDQDFELWLLTSPELPGQAMERLQLLCNAVPQMRVLTSDERVTDSALADALEQAAEAAGGPVMQFRIDDDDTLSRHYIARLRACMRRFDGIDGMAISMAGGLIVRSYANEPLSYWAAKQIFGSAGAAARFSSAARSIYSRNHFDLPRHLTAFSEVQNLNYVQLRWDEGDSAPRAQGNWDRRHVALDPEGFERLIEDDFPFLLGQDLSFMLTPES